jgi:hypothetical protein
LVLFTIITGIASILGFIVSVIAWTEVARLKRRYVDEIQISDLLTKAKHELAQAAKHVRARGGGAVLDGQRSLRKAIVHINALAEIAKLPPAKIRVEEIRVRIDINEAQTLPELRVLEAARADLDVLMTETENTFERMKRK